MKIIVTGANGFIGSSVIKKIIANNIHVLAIDISFADSKLPESNLITKKELSLDDIDSASREINFGEYDIFYHFAWAGVNGVEKGNIDVQLRNIEIAIFCAMLAKRIGCKKFLCSGTIAEKNVESLDSVENVGPGMFYGSAKHALRLLIETYCKSVGLKFVWMQFSNIYGPNNKTGNLISYTINQLNKNEYAIFGPSNQPYDFVFIDDLVEAVFRLGLIETHYNFYFVGSGKPRILSDYLIDIGRAFGKEELIRIGDRQDDGIRYSFDMFDNSKLIEDIGQYVSGDFSELIRLTIENYR